MPRKTPASSGLLAGRSAERPLTPRAPPWYTECGLEVPIGLAPRPVTPWSCGFDSHPFLQTSDRAEPRMTRKIMTMLQLLHDNQGTLTNTDLAQLADWASNRAKLPAFADDKDRKRAFSLIREGADLLLRQRTLREARVAAWTSKAPSMAELLQNPQQSTERIGF
jgi:hypothetical protein